MAKRTSTTRNGLFLVTAVLGAAGAVFAVLRARSRSGSGGGPVPVPKSGVPVPGVPVAPAAPGSDMPPPAPIPTAADFPPEAPSNAVENFEEATAPLEGEGPGDEDGSAPTR